MSDTSVTPTPEPTPDVTVENHGSIWLFRLQTDAARAWVEEHVSEESTMFGGALAVEHRFGSDLVLGMRGDGLLVTR